MSDEKQSQPAPETWPSPTINTLPPETKRRIEQMHDALSYHPPAKRDWTPVVYAVAATVVGGTIVALIAAFA